MRTLPAILSLVFAWQLAAQESVGPTLYAEVYDIPAHLVGGELSPVFCDETNGVPASAVVVDERPMGGDHESLENFLRAFHGRAVADELLESYRQNENEPERLRPTREHAVRFMRLDAFSRGPRNYDWDALNAEFPEIQVVVNVSTPALDSSESFAVVRYDVITRKGPAWSAFLEFQRQPDGAWSETVGRVGDLSSIE